MKVTNSVTILISLGIIIAAGILLYAKYKPAGYTHERYLRFTFTVQNRSKQLLKNGQAWVYGPVKQTAWQLTRQITADTPFELKTDLAGNQILHFTFKNLPPFATRVVTVSASVMLADSPQAYKQPGDIQEYLKAEPFIETQNKSLVKLAQSLSYGDDLLRISRSNFDWVSNNIKYAGFIKDDRGALYALKTRSGDCTEYMDLYTALERIDGIPARGISGYRVTENAVIHARDYHNWSESYLGQRWRVVDPQKKKFLQHENDYIAFKILRRENNKSNDSINRFTTTGDGLVLHMN